MPHLLDAVMARGWADFGALPFGDPDALALAVIAYLEVGDGCKTAAGLSLRETSRGIPADSHGRYSTLLRAMAASRRYADIRICHYANVFSQEEHMQFAAFCCDVPGVGRVIYFRGTDATIAGWHEDFAMLYESPVHSQTAALLYLQEASLDTDGPLLLTGHSKGGNLSSYAAAHAEPLIQNRILCAWSFDGPGLDEATVASAGYRNIRPRMRSILPEASFIGLLLGYNTDYLVVRSDGAGMRQHDPFTWLTKDGELDYTGETTFYSRVIDRTMHDCLDRMEPGSRRAIVDKVFGIVESSGARTLPELKTKLLTALPLILLGGETRMDDGMRDTLSDQMRSAVTFGAANAASEAVGSLITRALRRLTGDRGDDSSDDLPAKRPQ